MGRRKDDGDPKNAGPADPVDPGRAPASPQGECQAVEREASWFEGLLATSPDPVLVFDREARCLCASASGVRMFARQPREVVGKTWQELGLPEEPWMRQQHALASGQPTTGEMRLATPSGIHDYEYTLTPVGDRDGRPGAVVVALLRDVTARKRAEADREQAFAQLRSANERLVITSLEAEQQRAETSAEAAGRAKLAREVDNQRQLLASVVEGAAAAIALVEGPDFVYELANPAYRAIAPGKEMMGRPFAEVWPEVALQLLPTMERVRRTGQSYQAVDALYPIRRAPDAPLEDRYFTFSLVRVPLPDDRGYGVLILLLETTERKWAEEESARLAAIVQYSEDPIIGKTLDGIITSWNPAAARLYGYAAAEAVGQPISLIVPPDRAEEWREAMDRVGRGERVEHFETVRVRKNGERVDVSLGIAPIRDAAGR
ncbi:MAG: PAS domain-containing protein, partial [Chloroflexota bacterium]